MYTVQNYSRNRFKSCQGLDLETHVDGVYLESSEHSSVTDVRSSTRWRGTAPCPTIASEKLDTWCDRGWVLVVSPCQLLVSIHDQITHSSLGTTIAAQPSSTQHYFCMQEFQQNILLQPSLSQTHQICRQYFLLHYTMPSLSLPCHGPSLFVNL